MFESLFIALINRLVNDNIEFIETITILKQERKNKDDFDLKIQQNYTKFMFLYNSRYNNY
jgi:hypothetical protein